MAMLANVDLDDGARTCMCGAATQCEPDGDATCREMEESEKCFPDVGSAAGEQDVCNAVLILA